MSFRVKWRPELLRSGLYGLVAILAVVAYNTWMVCCGRCSVSNLMTIPWLGWGLLAANLCAGLTLWHLRRRNRRRASEQVCPSCRSALRREWVHCPNCGACRLPAAPASA